MKYKESTFSYLQFGEGEKLLIAFHGFAIEGKGFLQIKNALIPDYTVVALDLPFHGETKDVSFSFQKEELIEVVQNIICLFPQKKKVEFMGYSYGGRVALGVFSHFKINKLWLLASDGLEDKWNYNLPIYPLWFRFFIIKKMNNPKWFLKLIDKLYSLGLFPKYTHRFMSRHLGTKENRERLFGTWIFLHEFIINKNKLIRKLEEQQLEVSIIYGTDDTIINPKGGLFLSKKTNLVEVHFVEAGHKILGDNLNSFFEKSLKKSV